MPSTPAEQARFDELNDIRWIMDDPRGRAAMARLIALSRCRESCPAADHGTLAYWEGARLLGLELQRDIAEATPDKGVLMDKEYKTRMRRFSKQSLANDR